MSRTFWADTWPRLSIIPIGDAVIVLRGNGPKATAYGVHGTTATVMLGTAALLLSGPE